MCCLGPAANFFQKYVLKWWRRSLMQFLKEATSKVPQTSSHLHFVWLNTFRFSAISNQPESKGSIILIIATRLQSQLSLGRLREANLPSPALNLLIRLTPVLLRSARPTYPGWTLLLKTQQWQQSFAPFLITHLWPLSGRSTSAVPMSRIKSKVLIGLQSYICLQWFYIHSS